MTEDLNKLPVSLIGIVGLIGSGKGTVGDYLMSNYGYKSDSFANSLKDATSSIFGWDRNLIEGNTVESRQWREEVDVYWSEKMGREITPRWVLQNMATDVVRNNFDNNIWVWSLEKRLGKLTSPVVITDVRFKNEVEMIKNLGGKLIWIRRTPEPIWLKDAIQDKTCMYLSSAVHQSEYDWIGEADYTVIWNNSTLDNLYNQIDKIVK